MKLIVILLTYLADLLAQAGFGWTPTRLHHDPRSNCFIDWVLNFANLLPDRPTISFGVIKILITSVMEAVRALKTLPTLYGRSHHYLSNKKLLESSDSMITGLAYLGNPY